MYVCASTDCFPELPLAEALERLADLEFTRVEISLREEGGSLPPSEVHSGLDAAVLACRETHRLKPVAYAVDIPPDARQYYELFHACCRLAKATKVAAVTVPAAELGTPFNAEVERLRELVRIGTVEGVVVSVKTERDRMTQDPDTAVVLCDNVKGLAVALDPSHYICGPHGGASYDQLMRYVGHVQLRDSKRDAFQVRVGQGEIEYGRLVAQLNKVRYGRALSVHIEPMPDIEHAAELRKLRLLLESLL